MRVFVCIYVLVTNVAHLLSFCALCFHSYLLFFTFLGAPDEAAAAAGSPPLLPAAVAPAEPDAQTRGDAHQIETHQLANERGVVGVEEFTGEEAAAIVDERKSSKISLDNFSFVDDHGWTYLVNSIDKCLYCHCLTLVSWHLVVQRFVNLTKKFLFFGYILYPCLIT